MSEPLPSSILVVEDDDMIRGMVAEFLRDEGYTVIEADDGQKAMAALRKHCPPPPTLCLVILDMMLPGCHGVQVLRMLGTLGGYVPVVAVSANHDQLVRAEQAGAKAALPKPFDLDQLLTVVKRNCA